MYRKTAQFQLSGPVGRPIESIWKSDAGANDIGTAESKCLFGEPFATPKPEQLLERVIALATAPGDLVLDCFAGSGTTPAVAHKLGRRWLAIELEHDTVERFLLPRMEQVVKGTDRGGISLSANWAGGGGFTHLALQSSATCTRETLRPKNRSQRRPAVPASWSDIVAKNPDDSER